MMWDRTQDPFRWFDEILVDVFQISWSDSYEIRVQSLVSRLPSLIIPRIPSSRCLWSLAATLAQTYSYLFAFHHFWWLQDLHDWNKTFKEEKKRQLAAVFLALWSHLIWSLLALPWEGRCQCCWKIVAISLLPADGLQRRKRFPDLTNAFGDCWILVIVEFRCIWQLCCSKHQLFGSLAGAFKLGTNRCLAKDLELVATKKTLRFLFASCNGSSENTEILRRPYPGKVPNEPNSHPFGPAISIVSFFSLKSREKTHVQYDLILSTGMFD